MNKSSIRKLAGLLVLAVLLAAAPLLHQIPFLSGYLWLVLLYVLAANVHSICNQFARAEGHVRLFALDGILRAGLAVLFNILLLVLDDEQKTCNIIQINRDTMVKVGVLGVAGQRINTVTEQIALAHTYGNGREQSCLNTSEAVSGLLDGIKVDHYMSVTMDAVPVLNDLVGGIEVTVLDDFGDYDPTLIKGETVTLKGEQALHYVRGRIGVGDNSNLSRMARQREYMDAFFSKARQLLDGDDSFSADVMTSLAGYMISDCTVSKLQELSKKAGEYELGEIYAMEGEAVVGEEFMEFYPDEAALNSLIAKLFYVKEEE